MSKPVIQLRDKGLSISVFEKETADNKKYYSVCLQKSYIKKGDTDYTRETINLFSDDLPKLSILASTAYVDTLNQKPAPANVETTSWDSNIKIDNDEIPF